MLRDYQQRIVEEALLHIAAKRSPLIEMATGTGKTRTAAAIIKSLRTSQVLWIAHRTELLSQARDAIESVTGERVGIEQGLERAGNARIVVASKDTIRRDARLSSIRRPDIIVTDETHHSAAASYQGIYNAFPGAVRIGLSATPFRSDGYGLRMYDCRTTPYGIAAAQRDGWLVPFHAVHVRAESIDLSSVRVVAGDLSESDLAAVMQQESAIAEVIDGILETCGSRTAIVFAADVATAELYVNALNRRLDGTVARLVTGTTSSYSRAMAMRDFGVSYQYLVNVGIATEGTDLPAASAVVLARATKSVSLLTQMIGRGTRPLPALTGDTPEARRAWISRSAKQNCLVVDFRGNWGRHEVATVYDALRGTREPSSRKLVEQAQDSEISVAEALEADAKAEAAKRKAETEAERLRAKVEGDARARVLVAAYDNCGSVRGNSGDRPTPGQIESLLNLGVKQVPLTRGEAAMAIAAARREQGRCSPKQAAFVARFCGKDPSNMSAREASRLIVRQKQKWDREREART